MRRLVLLLAPAAALLPLAAGPAAATQSVPYLPPLTAAELTNSTVTTTTTSTGGDEDTTQTTVDTYEAHGRRISSVEETKDSGGTITRVVTMTFAYNSAGRLVRETWLIDHLVAAEPDELRVTLTTYDTKGFMTRKVVTTDAGNDGTVDATETYVFSGDRKNRSLSWTVTDDSPPGEIKTYLQTYDAHGNLLGRDFTVSSLLGDVYARSTESFTYDSQNHNLSASKTDFENGTDQSSRSVTTTSYDLRGNPTYRERRTYYGAPETYAGKETTTFSYDAKYRVVREVRASFTENDQPTLEGQVLTYGYDDKGRLVSRTQTGLSGGGVDAQAITYDAKNRIATTLATSRDGATLLSSVFTTYSYPSKSSVTTTIRWDNDGDGDYDATEVLTRTIT